MHYVRHVLPGGAVGQLLPSVRLTEHGGQRLVNFPNRVTLSIGGLPVANISAACFLFGQARLARFVNFLIVLCQCSGKSVRPNQWRVCRLLCEGSPELLLKLTLKGGRATASGCTQRMP